MTEHQIVITATFASPWITTDYEVRGALETAVREVLSVKYATGRIKDPTVRSVSVERRKNEAA